jgi:hypothetical protein
MGWLEGKNKDGDGLIRIMSGSDTVKEDLHGTARVENIRGATYFKNPETNAELLGIGARARWSLIDGQTIPDAAREGLNRIFTESIERERLVRKANHWYGTQLDVPYQSMIERDHQDSREAASLLGLSSEPPNLSMNGWRPSLGYSQNVAKRLRNAMAQEVKAAVASDSPSVAFEAGIRSGELLRWLVKQEEQEEAADQGEGTEKPDPNTEPDAPDDQRGDPTRTPSQQGQDNGRPQDDESGDQEVQDFLDSPWLKATIDQAKVEFTGRQDQVERDTQQQYLASTPLAIAENVFHTDVKDRGKPIGDIESLTAKLRLGGNRISKSQKKRHGSPSNKTWKMRQGQFKVFHGKRPHRGKVLLLVDQSPSMGCNCTEYSNSRGEGATGYIAWRIAGAIMHRFPDAITYAYAGYDFDCKVSLIPHGMRASCLVHDRGDKIYGLESTPDTAALLYIEKQITDIDGTMLIHICDGIPSDPHTTAIIARDLQLKGLHYATINIGHVDDEGIYPTDATISVALRGRPLTESDVHAISGLIEQVGSQTNT